MSNSVFGPKRKNGTFNSTWLKTYKGFEEYSEEEAERILEQLRELANIVCRHAQKTGT
jgi:NADPH-dependent 7-cyano-7-deazaguanine reductase QueF